MITKSEAINLWQIHQRDRYKVSRHMLTLYAALPVVKMRDLQPGEYYRRQSYESEKIGIKTKVVRVTKSGRQIECELGGSTYKIHNPKDREAYEWRKLSPELERLLSITPAEYSKLIAELHGEGHTIAPYVLRENIAALYPDAADIASTRLDYFACLTLGQMQDQKERMEKEVQRDLAIIAFLEKHPELVKGES